MKILRMTTTLVLTFALSLSILAQRKPGEIQVHSDIQETRKIDKEKSAANPTTQYLIAEQEITNIKLDRRPESVTFAFKTTISTTPIVEVSKRAPNQRLEFRAGDIVAVSFPALGGKLKEHKVTLKNLKMSTDYYYVITAADRDGKLIKKTGKFTTPIRFAEPEGIPANGY